MDGTPADRPAIVVGSGLMAQLVADVDIISWGLCSGVEWVTSTGVRSTGHEV